MQICCTKKLLTELGTTPEQVAEEKELFCWSAHLITVNRKKTLVVVNDKNRFGFILYGLKANDLKQLDKLILEGVRSSLRGEKIKHEIIEEYLQAAGDIVFTKTRGPQYVSRLNKVCILVDYFSDRLEPQSLNQINVSRFINNDLVRISKDSDYEHPYELLKQDFESFAGESIISCKAVELMIELNLGSRTAWRRIITPEDITFRQFHKILQVLFDWKNYHLYNFNLLNESGGSILRVASDMEEDYGFEQKCKTLLDTEVKLSDYIKKDCTILYCYDYGENWRHMVVVKDIIENNDKDYPVCLQGEGNAPPEDVGGIPGYEEFLKIMSDPDNEEYKTTGQWASSQWYKDFNIDLVNRRLRGVLRVEH